METSEVGFYPITKQKPRRKSPPHYLRHYRRFGLSICHHQLPHGDGPIKLPATNIIERFASEETAISSPDSQQEIDPITSFIEEEDDPDVVVVLIQLSIYY
ncbi:unnamed protein product [Orchesella dallaii]|uniref:Uncharacterized protein n=1 Tax=Orchesella dallaii TaxID=48710 RepID=A0ABP1RK80_9HEXA